MDDYMQVLKWALSTNVDINWRETVAQMFHLCHKNREFCGRVDLSGNMHNDECSFDTDSFCS